MIRYIDSGAGGPETCLGKWLDEVLVPGIGAFRGQFGFYDGSALRDFIPVLSEMVVRGGTFRLVVGANGSDLLSREDLEALLPLVTAGDGRCKLSVVGLSSALFHPKTLHIIQASGKAVAVVGSANLTAKGLGHHVEAGVVIEEADTTHAVLDEIKAAIDRWADCDDDGVHQVLTDEDIRRLFDLGLVVSAGTRRRMRGRQRDRTRAGGRGRRPTGWRPAAGAPGGGGVAGAEEPPEVEGAGEGEGAGAPEQVEVIHRWCKQLSRSDALQTPAGTNITGKLRLGRAQHEIDKNVFFRHQMFGEEEWVQTVRRGQNVDEAHIEFEVYLHGEYFGPQLLLVDHGEHRIADQNNVPTVLGWGHELAAWLKANPQTGNWVVLERDENGVNWLRIQGDAPDWAPGNQAAD